MGRCVLRVLVKFPACSHQRPERHAHCRVRDDGCTQSQSVHDCASFVSSSRNSNRTTTRSSPHARRPSIVDTSKTKAQIWAKGTTERASLPIKKKNDICNYRKIFRERTFPLQFDIDSKNIKSVIIFAEMVFS